MGKSKRITDPGVIIYRRYIKGNPQREAWLVAERLNAEIASMVYNLRTEAGLTQKELAERIGTKQSVISRLEDADYEGHSLSILRRIARALNRRLSVTMTAEESEADLLRTHGAELSARARKYETGVPAPKSTKVELDFGRDLLLAAARQYLAAQEGLAVRESSRQGYSPVLGKQGSPPAFEPMEKAAKETTDGQDEPIRQGDKSSRNPLASFLTPLQ